MNLTDKVDNALNESRILLLGGQVLIGALFRATFDQGFRSLPLPARVIAVVTLGLLLVCLGLLLWPVSYHRIVERGQISQSFHRLISHIVAIALFPLACAIGTFFYLVLLRTPVTAPIAIAAGGAMALVALFFWYGLELVIRSRRGAKRSQHPHKPTDHRMTTTLSERIKDVLIECRMVLPGAQALLGFQFITVFMDRFEQLDAALKYLHIVSLFCVAVATVLLITPAAYHRIVEAGEETETFHRFAGQILLTAMVFLGAGVSGDFWLVVFDQTGSRRLALTAAITLAAFLYGLWFAAPLYWRRHRREIT